MASTYLKGASQKRGAYVIKYISCLIAFENSISEHVILVAHIH